MLTYLIVGGILAFAIYMLIRNFRNNLKGKCNCSSCGPEEKKMCSSAIEKSKKD